MMTEEKIKFPEEDMEFLLGTIKEALREEADINNGWSIYCGAGEEGNRTYYQVLIKPVGSGD